MLPLPCDDQGPRADRLAAAVQAGAAAFLFQPRAHSPVGHSMTAARATELAQVLGGTGVLVIEDDGVGEVALGQLRSLGTHLPEQTVLVRSFSKSHGPDLRLAVLAGARGAVERVRAYRNFGAGWISRILQDALAFLLTDTAAQVDQARSTYADRRERLARALRDHGVEVVSRDGLSLWVPVHDERHALVTLAAHGIAVSPGSRFYVHSGPPHVRVATSRLTADYDQVTYAVALAAGQ